jgi:hypothetical protein
LDVQPTLEKQIEVVEGDLHGEHHLPVAVKFGAELMVSSGQEWNCVFMLWVL